jgi:RNA polymerase sigma factor (sigma-70 family)
MKNYKKYRDDELIATIAKSKEPQKSMAFSELYDRYSSKIYLYCRKVFGDGSFAEDIFQETFLQLLKSIENNVKINSVKAYLLITARNLSLNFKRQNRVETVEYNDLMHLFNDRTYEMKEITQLVDSALDLLSEDQKEAFILQVYNGLSYSEIANITNVPLTTVRNRVVRAKYKLREILTPVFEEKK